MYRNEETAAAVGGFFRFICNWKTVITWYTTIVIYYGRPAESNACIIIPDALLLFVFVYCFL